MNAKRWMGLTALSLGAVVLLGGCFLKNEEGTQRVILKKGWQCGAGQDGWVAVPLRVAEPFTVSVAVPRVWAIALASRSLRVSLLNVSGTTPGAKPVKVICANVPEPVTAGAGFSCVAANLHTPAAQVAFQPGGTAPLPVVSKKELTNAPTALTLLES